ncbi:hypothetical protein [Caballeronia sp. ATUFL_M1_KS5A]|uniref:hypothetical protein n=1 Tax=Caballeronia sp. ATUFL_M1_KS5A TaxID=2921778 RepID=UPI0020291352|nr:hypothetical protein [Caballeronia sp. ATUFL_M1_KS5A]
MDRKSDLVHAEIEVLINDTVALLPRTEIFQTLVVLSKSRLTLQQPRRAVDIILRAVPEACERCAKA